MKRVRWWLMADLALILGTAALAAIPGAWYWSFLLALDTGFVGYLTGFRWQYERDKEQGWLLYPIRQPNVEQLANDFEGIGNGERSTEFQMALLRHTLDDFVMALYQEEPPESMNRKLHCLLADRELVKRRLGEKLT